MFLCATMKYLHIKRLNKKNKKKENSAPGMKFKNITQNNISVENNKITFI